MKQLKGIPVRIFIVVLLTGIIGIAGILLMRYEINSLTDNYGIIIEEHVQNRDSMANILSLIYEHRSVMADCLLVTDKEHLDAIEKEEKELRTELQDALNAFGVQMQQDEKEVQYHRLYSAFQSYLKITDVARKLYKNGSAKAASEYVSTTLVKFADKINDEIEKMDNLTVSQMEEAKEKLENDVQVAQLNAVICTIMIVVAVIICLFYCVKVTSALDRQRTDLAEEVRKQTEALKERNEKVLDMKDQTIIGMANLIENRDGDTGGHIKRTSLYVETLAKMAQKVGYCRGTLTDHYIELLVKAAPMHDVGKIVVPDYILKKPGRLTSEEFEQIKLHAAEGGRIVKEVLGNIEDSDYVEMATQIAEGHHEKWNGSGYPVGKREEEIPLCARIMAIADVYDALVAKRCYKEAMSYDEAMAIIEESSGSHFDPTLATLFLQMREEVQKISESFKD